MADLSNEILLKKLQEAIKHSEVASQERPTRQRSYEDELKAAGFGIYTGEGRGILNKILARYDGDFRTFFTKLSKMDDPNGVTPGREDRFSAVGRALSTISSLVEHVKRMLHSSDLGNAPKDLALLQEWMGKVDKEFNNVVIHAQVSQTLTDHLAKVEQSTQISIDDLRLAQGIFGRKLQEVNKPKVPSVGMQGLTNKFTSIGKALLYSSLTPLAPLFNVADEIGKIAGAALGDRARRKEMLNSAELTSIGANVAPSTRFASEARSVAEMEPDAMRRGWRGQTTGGAITQALGVQESLFMFFNARAYQARWTKELLEGVSSISGKSVDKTTSTKPGGLFGPGSLLGNLATGIGNALGPVFSTLGKTLANTAAVSLAAVGGWLLGRWLGEHIKWGGKTLDQHTQGFMLHAFLGGDERDRLKKLAKEEKDPVMRRSYELQLANPNMTTGEASKRAADEWKNRPAPSGMGLEFRIGDKASKDIMKSDMSRDWAAKKEATLDKATGMYVVESKTGGQKFMGVTPEEAINKRSEFEATISKVSIPRLPDVASPSSGSNTPQPKVPIDTTIVDATKAQTAGFSKLTALFEEVNENIKDTIKTKTTKLPSGFDTTGLRNPLLSSLGAGDLSPAT